MDFYLAVVLLFKLVFCHYLADYPLQGPFLSEAKNHTTELGRTWWPQALTAHCFIHAGFVFLVTNSLLLALCEFVLHGVTDYLRCDNRLSINEDQFIHLLCKVVWVFIAIYLQPW